MSIDPKSNGTTGGQQFGAWMDEPDSPKRTVEEWCTGLLLYIQGNPDHCVTCILDHVRSEAPSTFATKTTIAKLIHYPCDYHTAEDEERRQLRQMFEA